MNGQSLRLVAAAVLLWVVFGGGGGGLPPSSSSTYSGPMSAVHSSSRSMPAEDRAALSLALEAGGNALAKDSRGYISSTSAAQRYVGALLEFSYQGMGQPRGKYPAVADALSDEMRKVVGDTDQAMDSAARGRLAESLREAGRAVR